MANFNIYILNIFVSIVHKKKPHTPQILYKKNMEDIVIFAWTENMKYYPSKKIVVHECHNLFNVSTCVCVFVCKETVKKNGIN